MIVKHLAVFHFLPGLQTLLTWGAAPDLQLLSLPVPSYPWQVTHPLCLLSQWKTSCNTINLGIYHCTNYSQGLCSVQGVVMVKRSCTVVFVLCRHFIIGSLIHGPPGILFLEWIKSRLPHLSRPFFKIFADCDIQPHMQVKKLGTQRVWASRTWTCGSGGGDTELSFIHHLYFTIQKEALLLKRKAKVLFLFFISQAWLHTHTHRGVQAAQSSSWNFPLNTSRQGLRKQLITTANRADCQGKQIFWTYLKQYLILHSPWLLLALLSCCART